MKTKILSAAITVCLLFCLLSTADAASIPTSTMNFNFNPTWNIEASDSFSGSLGALGVGVSVGFSYSFDAGVSLPVILNVEHPSYILANSSAQVNITAQGASGARAWAYAAGAVSASIDAGMFGSYSLVDESINLGDETTFDTPLGTEKTVTIEAEMLLGSQTINLLIVSYTFELFISVTIAVTTSTWLSSDLSITGSALTSQVQDNLRWNDESDIEMPSFSVGDQTGTYVDLDFQNIAMHVERLSFVLQSMSFHLRANGDEVAAIEIPTPPLGFTISSDGGQTPDNTGFVPLADASGTVRDLGSKMLSIYVGVPFPNIISPGLILMIVPSIGGLAYGRRREEGSKSVGSALMVVVVIGAGLYLGLDLISQISSVTLVSSFAAVLIPPFELSGSIFDFITKYLPWMLAGLAVGGATKRMKTGAILGFAGPLVLFLLNGLLQSDLQSLAYSPALLAMAYAGAITAAFGVFGAAATREHDYGVYTTPAYSPVQTTTVAPPPTPSIQETYKPHVPSAPEDLDDGALEPKEEGDSLQLD
jgi:hypothetical protein